MTTHSIDTGRRRASIQVTETPTQINVVLTLSAYGIMGDEPAVQGLILTALKPYEQDLRRIVLVNGRQLTLALRATSGWTFKHLGYCRPRRPAPLLETRWK